MILYTISMTAVCDGCGLTMETATLTKPSEIDSTRWDWKRKWKKARVMTRERKYKRSLIYCAHCADGPPKGEA